MEKLCNLVDIIENNENCVILKVKENKKMELIKLGYFDLTDNMFRLTKGKDHTCTIFKTDNTSYSWNWGQSGYTLVSDNQREKGNIIQSCIENDFDIYIGENKKLIEKSLYIKSITDTIENIHIIESMYFDSEDSRIIHKDYSFYKQFQNDNEFKTFFNKLGVLRYVDTTRSKNTNCIIEKYIFIKKGE